MMSVLRGFKAGRVLSEEGLQGHLLGGGGAIDAALEAGGESPESAVRMAWS